MAVKSNIILNPFMQASFSKISNHSYYQLLWTQQQVHTLKRHKAHIRHDSLGHYSGNRLHGCRRESDRGRGHGGRGRGRLYSRGRNISAIVQEAYGGHGGGKGFPASTVAVNGTVSTLTHRYSIPCLIAVTDHRAMLMMGREAMRQANSNRELGDVRVENSSSGYQPQVWHHHDHLHFAS